jgi:hypothetical protein
MSLDPWFADQTRIGISMLSGNFADAGFDHIALPQIGPEQAGFFGFYKSEVLPRLSRSLQIQAHRVDMLTRRPLL